MCFLKIGFFFFFKKVPQVSPSASQGQWGGHGVKEGSEPCASLSLQSQGLLCELLKSERVSVTSES